ncbi:winged helix-turn-helix transcriptional regulator [Catellatospora sichuanensis]|uniref:winged helix-turn-helix transcriptional regulator n=1 Tax=Catellatospora sichuanensis TaxID=1969805 RepID=UPI0011830D84|nr:helix-turn-helix domain-containing protein [Catellatospora sichuanensis]
MTAPLAPDMFDEICPSDLSPIRFGDKWTGMVIRCLEGGPRRFSELRVPLRGVTAKVLTKSLRTMERDGLVARRAADRQVVYELTPLGRSMIAPMDAACAWAREHWDELLDAREAVPAHHT